MKLRLRGNTLRLRLVQTEVARLAAGERIEERVDFGASQLVYALGSGASQGARFDGGTIEVTLPAATLVEWASTDRVGIEATEGPLRITVEKDWQCARPRDGEDESDAYPHPTGSC